nr:hypothetical protein [Actinomycetota bacterium]
SRTAPADYAGAHRYLDNGSFASTQVVTTTDGTPLGQGVLSPMSTLRGGHFTAYGAPVIIGS